MASRSRAHRYGKGFIICKELRSGIVMVFEKAVENGWEPGIDQQKAGICLLNCYTDNVFMISTRELQYSLTLILYKLWGSTLSWI